MATGWDKFSTFMDNLSSYKAPDPTGSVNALGYLGKMVNAYDEQEKEREKKKQFEQALNTALYGGPAFEGGGPMQTPGPDGSTVNWDTGRFSGNVEPIIPAQFAGLAKADPEFGKELLGYAGKQEIASKYAQKEPQTVLGIPTEMWTMKEQPRRLKTLIALKITRQTQNRITRLTPP